MLDVQLVFGTKKFFTIFLRVKFWEGFSSSLRLYLYGPIDANGNCIKKQYHKQSWCTTIVHRSRLIELRVYICNFFLDYSNSWFLEPIFISLWKFEKSEFDCALCQPCLYWVGLCFQWLFIFWHWNWCSAHILIIIKQSEWYLKNEEKRYVAMFINKKSIMYFSGELSCVRNENCDVFSVYVLITSKIMHSNKV